MNIKKISIFLFLVFFVFCSARSVFATVFEVDQSYKPYPAFGSHNISTNSPIAQTFKPTKKNLSSALIVITTASTGDYNFTLYLKRSNTTLASNTITQNLTPGIKTLTFNFNNLPSLNPGSEHALYLETTDSNAKWNYGQSDGVGGYVGGHGIVNGSSSSVDFHFVTYGPIEQASSDGQADDEDQEDKEKSISSGLEIPTNLEVLSKGKDYVEISWDEVDDENLAGYKIYYGEKRKELDEEVNVGLDNTYTVRGLETEKFYYFAITAYDEDRKESNKSKILQVKTKSGEKKTDPWDIAWYIARILSVLILVGAIVLWYWWKKKTLRQAQGRKAYEKEKKINVNIQEKDSKNTKKDYPKTKMKFED